MLAEIRTKTKQNVKSLVNKWENKQLLFQEHWLGRVKARRFKEKEHGGCISVKVTGGHKNGINTQKVIIKCKYKKYE